MRWHNVKDFVGFMQANEMFLVDGPHPRLTLLPSETTTCKYAILSGVFPSNIEVPKKPEDILKRYWGAENYELIQDIESFIKPANENTNLFIYMYDELDKMAHSTLTNKNLHIKQELEWIAEKARKISSILAKKKRVKIVVSSDHGCVQLPQNSYEAYKPPYSQLDGEHNRYAIVKNTKDLDPGHWHIIDSITFGLKETYCIPKGYSFIETRPRGMTHGGLTPEETIVAHMEFELTRPQWIPLGVVYRGTALTLGQEQKIILVIQNKNQIEVSDLRITIPELMETELTSIAGDDECDTEEVSICLHNRITVSDDEKVQIIVKIKYRVFDRQVAETIAIRLPIFRILRPSGPDIFGEK